TESETRPEAKPEPRPESRPESRSDARPHGRAMPPPAPVPEARTGPSRLPPHAPVPEPRRAAPAPARAEPPTLEVPTLEVPRLEGSIASFATPRTDPTPAALRPVSGEIRPASRSVDRPNEPVHDAPAKRLDEAALGAAIDRALDEPDLGSPK
ncbi:MAG TPA: hypothetical protein VF516_45965, partial [Kofleriaceae bacterium]